MNILDLSDPADRQLGKILELQAAQNGDTEYLITDSQRITYAEANATCDRLAAGFKALGVGKGDRVTMFMSNVPEMVLMCLALNKLGAIWVPICTDYKGEWLLDSLERSRADILVTDAAHWETLAAIRDKLDLTHCIALEDELAAAEGLSSYASLLEHEPYTADYSTLDWGDTCAILWTSGTTGKSKGVMVAHNNWIRSNVLGTQLQYTAEPGDIIYCAMPLYNAGAWITCVARALLAGVGVVIEEKFSVSAFMERVKHFNATQTFAVGSMGVFLMSQPEKPDDADNPMREALIVPMPPAMWSDFEKRFDVKLVRSGLGQSECLLSLNHEHSKVKAPMYALGWPPPDVDVRLFDDEGNEVPDGEPGEICVKPLAENVVFNGYFDNPEATANAFRGEWFLTGDMARKDPENGVFYFVDRKKDAVRFAGRNISTLEVESVALRHPEVQEVAAFGIPSEALESEDEMKLNVVRTPGSELTPEDLCRFLNENAPYYFVPRYLDMVESLPYTPTNKVQKYKLREAGVSDSTWDLKTSGFEVKR